LPGGSCRKRASGRRPWNDGLRRRSDARPYFRELVKERLPIPFDVGVDPLTVVARGAAIFAGSQRVAPRRRSAPSTRARLAVELIYKSVGADPEPLIGGKVAVPPGAVTTEYTIEVVKPAVEMAQRQGGAQGNGAFQFAVRAERDIQNLFRIEVRDPAGNLCPTVPDQFHYTIGVIVEEQPIINNMWGWAMVGQQRSASISTKGQGLPAKHTRSYRTTVGLRQGESGSVVKIPGRGRQRGLADRKHPHRHPRDHAGPDRPADLPSGSEVEVTLRMDTSRLLTVVAYVPLLDEEFPPRSNWGGKCASRRSACCARNGTAELARLTELKHGLEEAGERNAVELLQELEKSRDVAESGAAVDGDGRISTPC